MIKNKTVVEVDMGERRYQLEMAPESPLGEIYDALALMRAVIMERMESVAKAQAKPQENKEVKAEEEKKLEEEVKDGTGE